MATAQAEDRSTNKDQARDRLNDIATAAFKVNINNPDKMQMDNSRFIDMHINQIMKESHGSWNYKLADRYVDRLDHMMRRD